MQQNKQIVDDLNRFLKQYYEDKIAKLAQRYPDDQKSLYVDYDDLYVHDRNLAEDFQANPDQMREYAEEALRLYDLPADISLSDAHFRVYNLPRSLAVPEAGRTDHIGELIDVSGQVSKVSDVKPKVVEAAFECQRCGTMSLIPQSNGGFEEPYECQGCERQGPFRVNFDQSEFVDHQHARIQQPPEETKGGNAQHTDIHLEDDLVDAFNTGDVVTLTAKQTLDDSDVGDSGVFDTKLEGWAVRTEESDYEDIDVEENLEEILAIANGEYGNPYELLMGSINPKHKGDETIKLAIALQQFGGWRRHHPDGSTDRGDSHVLLLGDPGCGKSTFLRSGSKVAPRSTYASGKGATASGLTAAAVRDDFGETEWGLEAGALVLADGGIACVDEIDKMEPTAVSSMHEALEEQKVEISKAGINATLRCRTSLLAAGNPEDGRFDSYRPKAEQIDLDPALMSRFDLMFMVSDQPDREVDKEVVKHMIDSRRAAGKHTLGEELTEEEAETVQPAIPREVLRAYIAHARQSCFPIIEDEKVEERLSEEFLNIRNADYEDENEDSPVPVTYRSVDAIQRLSEASARVRLSETIEMQDVDRAIDLVLTSMKQVGYDPETGEFDADIVETGQSKSQRDRVHLIKDVVRDLEEPTTDDVVAVVKQEGWSEQTVRNEIEEMREKGKLYHPFGDDGEIRVT